MALHGLLRLDYLTNPYHSISHLYEPELYAPLMQDLRSNMNLLYRHADLPFARTHDELVLYCRDQFLDHGTYSCYQHAYGDHQGTRLPGLVCISPLYARALIEAADHFPVSHRYRCDAPLARHSVYWVKVWPWLDESVRVALRRHVDGYFADDPRAMLALIDDTVEPRTSSTRYQSWLGTWLMRNTPIVDRDWHEALGDLVKKGPGFIVSHGGLLLLHFAPTHILDAFAERLRAIDHITPVMRYPMASPALVGTVAPLKVPHPQEKTSWLHSPCDHPIFATMTVTPDTSRLTGRDLLFALAESVSRPQLETPTLTVEPAPAVIAMLQEEASGPYADLVTLVARRLPNLTAQPRSIQELAMTPFPITAQEINAILHDPTQTLPNLARCLHGIMCLAGNIGLLAIGIFGHASATRDLVLRGLSHSSLRIQTAAATSCLLTEEEDRQLILSNRPEITSLICVKRPMTTWIIEWVLQHDVKQDLYVLAEQAQLSPGHIEALFQKQYYPATELLAQCGRLTPDQYSRLETCEDPDFRAIAAKHADAEGCARLSRDTRHVVTKAVADNPNATRETVEFLAKRHRKRLASVLVTHPNLSDQTRISLTML